MKNGTRKEIKFSKIKDGSLITIISRNDGDGSWIGDVFQVKTTLWPTVYAISLTGDFSGDTYELSASACSFGRVSKRKFKKIKRQNI